MILRLAHAYHRAQPQPRGIRRDRAVLRRQPIDVHKLARLHDLQLGEVDHRGAARQVLRGLQQVAAGVYRGRDILGAAVGEGAHQALPICGPACRMAATILG